MEEVLDLYKKPYDPRHPMLCMDELSTQLIGEVRDPLPTAPGKPLKYDTEYTRNGTVNIFMTFEPLAGTRFTQVTERRTKLDWAHYMKALVDDRYPEAERLCVILDNLNTHNKSSLYEAFAPLEAKRIADKLDLHYTPKHGSWLNMAEIELSHLSRQCLAQRIAAKDTVITQVEAWTQSRNAKQAKAQWQFTTADARVKLRKLYPTVSS
jgi:hypothetical protein